jgi:hypothetical protein
MSGSTPRFAFEYPTHDDPPAGHTEIKALAEEAEARVAFAGAQGGRSVISASQSRTNTAYGKLGTPDQVSGLLLPTDGFIFVLFEALWQQSVSGAARAALFIGSNQLQIRDGSSSHSGITAARLGTTTGADRQLATDPGIGLASGQSTAMAPGATTPVVAGGGYDSSGVLFEVGAGPTSLTDASVTHGGILAVWVDAGTYDVSVQFKASTGSVTASNRRLFAWTREFPVTGV